MKIINIHQAKTTLSQLIESVLAGEEVIVSKAGKPLVRLIPYQPEKKKRTPGYWEGQVKMGDDFDDPLPPEILAGFMGLGTEDEITS
jgi:prevent-host-death family protein